MYEWALSKIGTLSVMQIVKVLDVSKDQMMTEDGIKDITTFLAEWDSKISEYNWMEDEMAPLGINRRKEFGLRLHRDIYRGMALSQIKSIVEDLERKGETDTEQYVMSKYVLDKMNGI